MKSIKITEPLFRTCLEIIITDEDLEVDRYLNNYGYKAERTHEDSQGNTYRLRFSNSSSNHTLIRLREKSMPTLVHELIHHAMITFMDKSINVNQDDDELLCYFVEYFMVKLLPWWNKEETKKSPPKQALKEKK